MGRRRLELGWGMTEVAQRAVGRALIKKTTNTTTLFATAYRTARFRWRRSLVLTGVLAALLTSLSAGSASAQSWSGATSNDWTVGSNWSGGAAPTGVGRGVTIGKGPVVLGVNGAASGATNGLLTEGTSTSLTIENGSTLTSNGFAGISSTPTSTVTATVTGAGSLWNADRPIPRRRDRHGHPQHSKWRRGERPGRSGSGFAGHGLGHPQHQQRRHPANDEPDRGRGSRAGQFR